MATDDAPSPRAELQPQPASVDFNVGDVVLAFHGQLLYEAKILEVGPGTPAESYHVHYQGWKKSWDETVPRSEVVVHNDENLRIAHELLRSAKSRQLRATVAAVAADPGTTASAASARGPADASAADPSAADAASRQGKPDEEVSSAQKPGPSDEAAVTASADAKREPDSNTQTGTQAPARRARKSESAEPGDPASLFEIPASLKRQLVDDWEFVTKEHKLVTLPRDVTVAKLLTEWLKSRAGGSDRASRELVESLLEYFDALLPTMLLYRFERPQFHELLSKSTGEKPRPSDVYGAEHLLRMFVKLPYLLTDAKIDPELMKEAAARVNEIAKFIQKNGRVMILAEYEPATPQYMTQFTQ